MINVENISFKKKVALDLFNIKKNLQIKTHELQYLFWECTLRCNLSCRHCGSDCNSSADVKDMPAQDFLDVLEKIKNHVDQQKSIVVITGGEPLMRNDLEEVTGKIRDLGYNWGMVTNGYLMTEDRFKKLFASGLKSMTISLDGMEEDHDWLRGKNGSFKNALNAVKMAAEASKKGLVFDVVTCVNQRNFNHLEKFKELLISCGLKRWRTVRIFPKGRAAEDKELKLTPEQMKDFMSFMKRTRDEGKITASYGCESFLGGWELEVRDKPFFCIAGVIVGSVLVDGSISACPSLRADYIQGNIYKDDFMDVWENKFDNMRNREWLKTGECKDCKVWKYCKGNGLHLRDEKSGELLCCDYNILKDVKN